MIDDFIEVLNRLLEIDPVSVQDMIEKGRINSIALGNADYEKTKGLIIYVDKAYTYMSMLGVINSVLAKEDRYNLICAVYDEKGKIIRFSKWQDEKGVR